MGLDKSRSSLAPAPVWAYLYRDAVNNKKSAATAGETVGPSGCQGPGASEGDRRPGGQGADTLWRLGEERPLHRFLMAGSRDWLLH
jgi:hypothetical protein